MISLPNIPQLFDENNLDIALDVLNRYIVENPQDDNGYFMRGKLWWRLQKHSAAVTDYETAVALNPDSEARHALDLARSVFNYFNPDLLNP